MRNSLNNMKRSILGLLYLIQGMRHAGIDIDARLAQMGIKADALDPASIIFDEIEWDIVQHISQDVAPEQGLFIGQHYALTGYGPFLMLLVSSDTLDMALYNGIRFQRLTHLFGSLKLVEQKDSLKLLYSPLHLDSEVGQFRAQCEISGTYKFIQDILKMIGSRLPEIQVELPFKWPKNLELIGQYQAYYGQNVRFECEQTAFILTKSEILHTKLSTADQVTYRIYEEKCLAEIEILDKKSTDKSNIVDYIQDYLELQHGIIPTMAETAYALNIPERTLRHQLQQMQTNYKEIRARLIRQKALKLMQNTDYSIEHIAELLGYSEPAAFNHAFKRWFGQSPRQYIRRSEYG